MQGKILLEEIEAQGDIFIDLAKRIWEYPEVAFEEEKASEWAAEVLEEAGFAVERGYTGLPTAIRATWGSGSPVVGFLGEHDALSGMSQEVTTEKKSVSPGAHGQGCGHNLLGVAHVAAAIGLKEELAVNELSGTVVFYGCPAEETLTGKTFMARAGAFRELDIHFSWHPWPFHFLSKGKMLAVNGAKFHFSGVTAHAGADPHKGRSALDAAELMNIGANYLREHVTDDVRIHYVYTNGGRFPNVVPDKASTWYYVRALSRRAVEDTYERLLRVARGAAMMTETEVEVEFMGGCYNTLQNPVLLDLIHQSMEELPNLVWTEEEIQFAAQLNETSANYANFVQSGKITADTHLDSQVPNIIEEHNFASTDVGDVQHIAPGVIFMTTASNIGAALHSWHITASSGSSIGMKGMLYAAKVMALAGAKAVHNPELVVQAKAAFREQMGESTYQCPIPDHIPLPVKGAKEK